MMGAFAVSPANVQAHLFLGDVLYRVVDGLDMKRDHLLELLQEARPDRKHAFPSPGQGSPVEGQAPWKR